MKSAALGFSRKQIRRHVCLCPYKGPAQCRSYLCLWSQYSPLPSDSFFPLPPAMSRPWLTRDCSRQSLEIARVEAGLDFFFLCFSFWLFSVFSPWSALLIYHPCLLLSSQHIFFRLFGSSNLFLLSPPISFILALSSFLSVPSPSFSLYIFFFFCLARSQSHTKHPLFQFVPFPRPLPATPVCHPCANFVKWNFPPFL